MFPDVAEPWVKLVVNDDEREWVAQFKILDTKDGKDCYCFDASGALTRSRCRDLVFVDDSGEEVSSADGQRRVVCAR